MKSSVQSALASLEFRPGTLSGITKFSEHEAD